MPIPTNYIPLAGSERVPMPGARRIAATDPSERMQVTVMVRPRQALATAHVNHDAPPNERRYLSHEEYRAAYGANAGDLAQVEEFARSNRLGVTEVSEAQRSVKLTGTAGDFAKAFGVELHLYEHPGGTYRGRTGPVHIPKSLEGIVEGVFGLDNRPAAEPHCGLLTAEATMMAGSGGRTSTTQISPLAGGTFTAPQLARFYGFPPNANGAGQTIGIIELGGGINNPDLQPYFQGLGLPQPGVTVVSVDGGQNNPNPNDNNATLEVMLDIEVAGAIASRSNLAIYFAPNTDQSFINAVNAAVHDAQRTPSVISVSWGKSEDSWTPASRQAMDQALQAASFLGITVYCASGDNGSTDGRTDGRQHADFPSSSPNALGCGGTSLDSNGVVITSEVAWNNGPRQISGGGISDTFGVPGYQASANLPPSANRGAGPGRGVPDVSGHAASYAIFFFGRSISAFGTSAVAPLWAGLTALINQTLVTRSGLMQPVLYRNPAALRNITSGNNGAYAATAGWDACTGLGSPNGASLVAVMKPAPARRGSRNFIQSNWGARGNFELLVPHGSIINQYFRNNDDPALPWHFLRNFGYPVPPTQLGPTPRGVTFLQSNFLGDGVHGNFETIVRVAPAVATQPHHLDFWFLDSRTSRWNGPFGLIADGQVIDGVTGDPVMIQGNWGNRGNFELLVPHGNLIKQYFRNNDDPALAWHHLRDFGYPAPPNQLGPRPRSLTFIQSNFKGDGVHGNFEVIVRVAPAIATQPDHLDLWFLDSRTSQWNGPFPLIADGQAIDGVTGDPVLIQSNWGVQGNFELLVPHGNVIKQYFRNNDDPALAWHHLRDFGYPVPPQQLGPTPRSVTFFQSNFLGDGVHGNFEAIVRVAPALATQPDHLDFWFLDSRTSQWNGPFGLIADGQPVTGVTGD